MTLWHALVARWRAAGFIGWREDGAAFCLLHANSAASGTLIGPKERAFVRAAGLRCGLCGQLLVDAQAERSKSGLHRALLWDFAQEQLRRLSIPDPRRCPHCGVPATADTKDANGVCRYCKDGTDTPF